LQQSVAGRVGPAAGGRALTAQSMGRDGLGDRLIRMGEVMIAAHDGGDCPERAGQLLGIETATGGLDRVSAIAWRCRS
jgi:hypothetical protein